MSAIAVTAGKKVILYLGFVLLLSCTAFYFWASHQLATVEISEKNVAVYLEQQATKPDFIRIGREPCSNSNPTKSAHFGALHVHTTVSGDAAGWGITASPQDAFDYARGERIEIHSLATEEAETVPLAQLDRPLHFAAVTDHANKMGEARICRTPGSVGFDSTLCRVFRGDIALPFEDPVLRSISRMSVMTMVSKRAQRICGEDGVGCLQESIDVWRELQQAAEAAYDRSAECRFTSFVGYEYTLQQEGSNLHRNVIFANGAVPPAPLSSLEAPQPEILWSWLKRNCQNSGTGCDAFSIPHNSNWSNGKMFFPYTLSDRTEEEQRRLAVLRNEMEPLAEIMQIKGDSECRNGLGRVFGGADEYCDFEKLRELDEEAEDCLDSVGSRGMQLRGCQSRWSFVRYGLFEGLREQKQLGTNSMKLGIVAATDTHIAAPASESESNWPGSIGVDYAPKDRLREPIDIPNLAKADSTRFSPGGLAGVWAEENNRESLFAAMRARETFGTSGPRILPRFFGGWNYPQSMCDSVGVLEQAYANGVPMGGDLPARPAGANSPTFLVAAEMDNIEGAAPLQKIQIIKGWTDDDGNMQQKVIDVAGDAISSATVDKQSCKRSGSGHANLCAVWSDKEFDPSQSAVYYSRVIETPSCRWTTHDCNSFPESERPTVCSNPTLRKTVQERAWTSPIWYTAS